MPLTEDDLKVVRSEIGEALKPHSNEMQQVKESLNKVNESVTSIGESTKSLTETVKSIADAGQAKKQPADPGKAKGDADEGAVALTADKVTEMISEALTSHTKTQQQSAEQAKATADWLKKNAPKLAGNEWAQSQFANAKTDDDRNAVLENIKGVITATGVKAPDLGASAEKEGGETPGGANTVEQQQAKAMEAAKQVGSPRL